MREMRRKKQHLTEEQIRAVIKRNTYGVLSLANKECRPYGVPLNYVYADGCFYFHCALDGQKTDFIAENEKASFCIVDRDVVVPETFSADFISLIAFGTVDVIEDEDEKLRTLWLLTDALAVKDHAKKDAEIRSAFSRVKMLRFKVEHMTGKAGLFLMKNLDDFFPELK